MWVFHSNNPRLAPVDTAHGAHLHALCMLDEDMGADDGVVSTIPPAPFRGGGGWTWRQVRALCADAGGLGGGGGAFFFEGGGPHLTNRPTQNAFPAFSCHHFLWRGVLGGGSLALGGQVIYLDFVHLFLPFPITA